MSPQPVTRISSPNRRHALLAGYDWMRGMTPANDSVPKPWNSLQVAEMVWIPMSDGFCAQRTYADGKFIDRFAGGPFTVSGPSRTDDKTHTFVLHCLT